MEDTCLYEIGLWEDFHPPRYEIVPCEDFYLLEYVHFLYHVWHSAISGTGTRGGRVGEVPRDLSNNWLR